MVIYGRSLTVEEQLLDHDFDEPVPTPTQAWFPFYTFAGGGNVLMDGTPRDITFSGGFVVSPDRTQLKGTNANGTFTSPELGTGVLQGNLMTSNDVRTARFLIKTNQRSFGLAGILDIAISPIISVQPSSGVNFGTITVGESKDQEFVITNIGVDTLDGEVTVTGTGFSILSGDSTYSLGPDEEARVTIRFEPTTAGSYSGTAKFTGGGGATRTLSGIGQASTPTTP